MSNIVGTTGYTGTNGIDATNEGTSATAGTRGGPGGVGANGITNIGNIYGGVGGYGGNGGNGYQQKYAYGGPSEAGRIGGTGGAGGTGVVLSSGTWTSTVQITGGAGGGGGVTGEYAPQPMTGADLAPGGSGGVGVILTGGTLTNESKITGGAGAYGGVYSNSGSYGPGYARPGFGAAGVIVGNGATLVNASGAKITGGAGAEFVYRGEYGGGYLGYGGDGVDVKGGSLTNAGTIAGGETYPGSGQLEDAVTLSGPAGTLIVDPDAVFEGRVVGSDNDTLELSGVQSSAGTGITLGQQFIGFSQLDFASGAVWTVDVSDAGTLGLQGFAVGDTIDLANLTPKQVAEDFGNVGAVSVAGGAYVFNGSASREVLSSADGNLTFGGNYSGEHFLLTSDGGGGTDVSCTPACFMRGTRILTAYGARAVEELQIGDQILTLAGRSFPIRWIGRRRYREAQLLDRADVRPVLIRAGALGDRLPDRDLWLSPEHALHISGALVPAGLLTNGRTVLTDASIKDVSYYHLEFDSHQVVFAEGAAAESFVDDDSRQTFDNAEEYRRMYPQAPCQSAIFCAPRLEQGEVLEAIRRQLMRRARSHQGCGSERPRSFSDLSTSSVSSRGKVNAA